MEDTVVHALTILLVAPLFAAEGPVEFNRDVRPILSDKCFNCHGPDAAAKKIPFRLDSEAAAKADLGGRRAIVDGDPVASQLVRRITSETKALRMPPVYSGLALTAAEIGTLRAWIEQGAKWQRHWSFIPPVRRPAPAGVHPIDHFVRERLTREELQPSPEASRETLLRRVSLDLTGLPPTPAEIDAFLAEQSPNAYEKVVDRLLASPRHGERMAARWLDAARYADSNGYQFDGERVMWRWRDWVINAFNRNLPYDRFTLEQIAGDMLPGATLEQKIATGFNRNHRANTEDGIIPEEYAVEYVVDRLETTSTVFLGLTLGCARCHNHKYDPFTQKEFYQVFAYFNNVPELGRAMKYGNSPPMVAAPTSDQQQGLAAIEARIRAEEALIEKSRPAQEKWEKEIAQPVSWVPSSQFQWGGQDEIFDGKLSFDFPLAGNYDIDDPFTLTARMKPERGDGAILSRMSDAARGKGYGVYLKQGKVHVHLTSNYADDAIRVDTLQALEAGRWHQVTVTYTGSRMAEGVRIYIDGAAAQVTVDQDTLYRPFRNAGRAFREPLRIGAGGGPDNRFRGEFDWVRVYPRVLDETEITAIGVDARLKPSALRAYFLENEAAPEFRDAWQRLYKLRLEREALERTFPTVMVMAERPVPKDTFLLVRGAYDKPGEKVNPGVPSVLPPLPDGAPNNRLGFAKWLVDPRNPLTARVAVNRFWQMYFGTGLVKTAEDFGLQGESPSHPELLDWLATEFVRTGWDIKAMQKLIVMSATYRQSSKATPATLQRDPENRLVARGPRNRLPAEMVRDQALAAAGLLVERIGGPSVKPYQPEGLWKELAMQDVEYVQSKGPDLHRRGLYTFWKRTIAPPMMVNFDSAQRESCVVREARTNTPLQALNLMNDVTFLEAARFIGQRMILEGGADATSRLRYGFRLISGREPSPAEAQVLRNSLQYHLDYFAGKQDEVRKYLDQGEARTNTSLDPRELAAYASVASLMFNTDEAVTKE